MILTNNQIYTNAIKLQEAFSDNTQKLPIKINFYIQKNKNLFIDLAKEIEQTRLNILKEIESEETAQQELLDLLNIEQDIQVYLINLNSFPEDLNLSLEQMNALMFMIEE